MNHEAMFKSLLAATREALRTLRNPRAYALTFEALFGGGGKDFESLLDEWQLLEPAGPARQVKSRYGVLEREFNKPHFKWTSAFRKTVEKEVLEWQEQVSSRLGLGPEEVIQAKSVRRQVFFSYSHKDKKWLEEFRTTLTPIMRDGMLLQWDDTKIAPGAKWKEEIRNAIASAKVAVLLVSKHFLASDFIQKNELPPLLKKAEEEGLIILWVPVSFSMYQYTEIAEYQAAHDPSRPLDSLKGSSRGKALVAICEQIAEKTQSS